MIFENNTVKGLYINRGSANFTSINDTFVNNDGVSGGAVKVEEHLSMLNS